MHAPSIKVIGPNRHGMYVVELRSGGGRSIALFVPDDQGGDVLRDIQERIPYGLVLHDPADAQIV
ncbi:MAG: hypothetical protein QOG83_2716 [Alphaproteobacteria bacterium]|jgi:hypothetical protein|nr:hypothetical protein [Alphaproteobacteria bacterium]MEA2990005.1 hypothetical protein [Alphaproteobacteria bacterium]